MMIKDLRANLVFVTLLGSLLISSAKTVNASAGPSPEPTTVADFFLLVPERYVGYPLDFRQQLLRGERRGTVIDIPNGYISWDASDNPEEFEFAIFRKSNGKYIVAFSSPGDPGLFPSRFFLLSYSKGKWRDVTKALLPIAFHKRFDYKLPRRGRTISVIRDWRVRYHLTWANDSFRVNRRRGK
ncbi:MAG TPA: hypothetical protein VFZ40_00120 [Pyrinomonadaceae bacterium]